MFWYGGLVRRPLAALLAAGMALAICCAVLWSSQPASSAERANSLRTSALGGLPNILNWLRVHELPVFDPAGRQSVLQMPVGHTTTFGASSVDASAEVADDGSITDSNNLARLQALTNKLEAAAPVPQRIPELVPVPIVKALSQAEVMVIKSDLPDSEDVLIVFDEAEVSVERALRRLAPSPGAQAITSSYNVPVPKADIRFCDKCKEFFNGAVDAPGAAMCLKKDGKQRFCYADNSGCPGDMKSYTCNSGTVDANGEMVPAGCSSSRADRYKSLKSDVRKLMNKLIKLKEEEQDLTLQLITNAQTHPTCSCQPVSQLRGFLGA